MTDPTLRLAVLDCDGTIVDSQTTIVNSITEAFALNNFEPPKSDRVRRIVGLHLTDAIEVLLGRSDRHLINSLVATYKEVVANYPTDGSGEDPLYPHAKETIETLDAGGWLLGVATGKSKMGLRMILDHYELHHHFSTTQTSDNGPGKPAPEMLYQAMFATGVEPDNTVMIGDTTYDIEMAINAGTRAIGVSWGYHTEEELNSAGANMIIHSYTELEDALNYLVSK